MGKTKPNKFKESSSRSVGAKVPVTSYRSKLTWHCCGDTAPSAVFKLYFWLYFFPLASLRLVQNRSCSLSRFFYKYLFHLFVGFLLSVPWMVVFIISIFCLVVARRALLPISYISAEIWSYSKWKVSIEFVQVSRAEEEVEVEERATAALI